MISLQVKYCKAVGVKEAMTRWGDLLEVKDSLGTLAFFDISPNCNCIYIVIDVFKALSKCLQCCDEESWEVSLIFVTKK